MAGARTYRSASGRSIEESLEGRGEKAFFSLGKQLYVEGQEIIKESLPLVPVDTGALRGSSYCDEPKREGTHVTVELGYGGVASKINPKSGEPSGVYALIVHENLEAHHEVGQAKYLQVPFDDRTKGMGDRIAEGMKADMRGAGPGAPEDQSGGGEGPK